MTKIEYAKSLSDYPEALTAAETAEILRVSIKTVYKLIKDNNLPAVQVGREKRIAKNQLIDYLQQCGFSDQRNDVVFSEKTSNKVWTCEKTCGIVRVNGQP